MTDLGVLIVSYNTRALLQRCLDALFVAAGEADLRLDVLVVEAGEHFNRDSYPSDHLEAIARIYRDGGLTIAEGTPPIPGSEAPHLPALHDLARGNPAARMLRLLEALARNVADNFSMAVLDGRVAVRVTPCSTVHASSN